MSRLGCSQLPFIHIEFLSPASPAVPKHSPAFTGQQATILSKKMLCILFLPLLDFHLSVTVVTAIIL